MINMLFSNYNFDEDWAKTTVSEYITADDTVLVIPFSFGDEITNTEDWKNCYCKDNGKYYHDIVRLFSNYNIKEDNISWLNYYQDSKTSANAKIKNHNIIFFTGGFADKMMKRLREFKLIKQLESFTGIMIGCSAGGMIQVKQHHLTPSKTNKKFSYNEGLNIINNFDIEVHYQGTQIQKDCIQKVLQEKKLKIYAISNTGGLIYQRGQVISLGNVQEFS